MSCSEVTGEVKAPRRASSWAFRFSCLLRLWSGGQLTRERREEETSRTNPPDESMETLEAGAAKGEERET